MTETSQSRITNSGTSNPVKFNSRSDMLLYFLRGSKLLFAGSAVSACLLAFFELFNPKIIGFVIDSVIGSDPSTLPVYLMNLYELLGGREFILSHMILVAAVIMFIAFLAAVSRYLYQVLNALAAEKLVKNIRDQLYQHLTSLPYAWYGENAAGDILQRCTSDVETIKRFLSDQLTQLFRIVVLLLLSAYFMLEINVWLAAASLAFIPVVVGYSWAFHNKIGSSFQKADEEEGRLSTIAQENLTGVRVIRAFGREGFEKKRFEVKNESYTHLWIDMMKLLSGYWALSDLFLGLQMITVLIFGAWLSIHGSLTAGGYVAFLSYNSLLGWPVRAMGRMISQLSQAGVSIDRIRYIMNAETEDKAKTEENPERDTHRPVRGGISFRDVSFSYGKELPEILKHVSFDVKPGTTLGILGGTGSGKSTLVHLLDRLYELAPDQGCILLDGQDIREIPVRELRRHIGLVLQEPYLFSRTLRENMMIGSETEEGAETLLKQAVTVASLEETIQKFGKGMDTYVGEKGVTLSGGQKQRTAIAQMLMRRPEIMIFDDSLSAVDAQTDARIRQALRQYTRNATVILISHRITTLMQADHILVMENGSIKEEGSHAELMQKGGLYSEIYHLQVKEA